MPSLILGSARSNFYKGAVPSQRYLGTFQSEWLGTYTNRVFIENGVTQWIVPAGVTSAKIECLGAGGSSVFTSRSGGAGAAYAADTISVTPGETLTLQVPTRTPAAVNSVGADCFVKRGSTTLVLAKSANAPTSTSASAQGGQASACVGAIKYSGGNAGSTPVANTRSGGGGAAGPNGPGASSGDSPNTTRGSGGGGANGGGVGGSSTLGTGGTGPTGITGGSPGQPGTFGSGGGGNNGNAGDNSHNAEWDSAHGCGSGAGGNTSGTGGSGASAGAYGGGAGGGTTNNPIGGPGLIVISY